MPKRRLTIQASTSGVGAKETLEDKGKEVGNEGINGNMKSKILSHFVKGIFSLTTMETILIVHSELEYLEGLVKLARKKKC
jgi:hypothetical protein